jgi:hypothetical protein
MIGVAEDDPGVELGFKGFETKAFDSTGSTDRHEDRRLDLPATRGQHTCARLATLGVDLEISCSLCH